MRVLVICDKPGWAFDAIARALREHNPYDDLELEIFYLKGNESALEHAVARNDVTFAMHWGLIADVLPSRTDALLRRHRESRVARVADRFPFIDPATTLVGLHGHHDWDRRRTDPGRFVPPPEALVRYLSRFAGVNAVSRRLTELFREAGLETVVYTPNGVDTDVFRPMRPLGTADRLRVGYAGTKKRDWKEGITEYIEPLAGVPWLDVRIATPQDGRYVPYEQMPDFYTDIDVYLCASRSEGFSLAVLEAAASGRPIVTTRVGGSEDLVRHGFNGLFVDRDHASIVSALEALHRDRRLLRELGENSRAEIERTWSWDLRAPDWLAFVRSASARTRPLQKTGR